MSVGLESTPGLPLPLLPITSEVLLRDNLLDSLVGTDTDDEDEIDLTLLHRPQPLSWAEGDVDDPEVLPAPQALTPAVHAIRWPPEAPAHSQ